MNSIFFLILIFVIDLILKSVKDKKKIEKARNKRKEELEKNLTSTFDEVKDKAESFLENKDRSFKDREYRSDKNLLDYEEYAKMDHSGDYKSDRNIIDYEKNDNEEFCGQYGEYKEEQKLERHRIRQSSRHKAKESKSILDKDREEKSKLKKELLKGLIYSEILSEPKSIKNSRRSM